ncbi:UPF0187 protein, chloroplastic isoform X2 [Cinnamomum micranthum f. kanehirae]|uniref:UPF0187 protein, chloroplastic isoform X2 n=1 Tax=Cinnamomum micranthum f. kanehirae TaxID=337451 RepID=A0A443P4Q9_9MAGN|nr:UPF0187 protein, chloroplastic isoform X2 [Cinnamomum micranthum f. kanehirae]
MRKGGRRGLALIAGRMSLREGWMAGVESEDDAGLRRPLLQYIMAFSSRPQGQVAYWVVICRLAADPQNMRSQRSLVSMMVLVVCEQLMGIPIPLSYTRLTSRFLKSYGILHFPLYSGMTATGLLFLRHLSVQLLCSASKK